MGYSQLHAGSAILRQRIDRNAEVTIGSLIYLGCYLRDQHFDTRSTDL